MRIGILVCDQVRRELLKHFCNYDVMMTNMLLQINPALEFKYYRAYESELPADIDECDGLSLIHI